MPQWTSYIHPYTLVSISIERAPKLAFLGQREFTQFYFSLWVSPTAIVFLPSFVFLSPLPLPFSRGTCVFRQESPAVRIPPCQVWIILAQWETGSAVPWLYCVSIASGWTDCLQFPLLIYSVLWNYTWSSSVAGAAW